MSSNISLEGLCYHATTLMSSSISLEGLCYHAVDSVEDFFTRLDNCGGWPAAVII